MRKKRRTFRVAVAGNPLDGITAVERAIKNGVVVPQSCWITP
jgi:hypothetical protein